MILTRVITDAGRTEGHVACTAAVAAVEIEIPVGRTAVAVVRTGEPAAHTAAPAD